MTTRLVVLDRDGVINRDTDAHIRSVDQWHAIGGSLEAIALLTQGGFTVAVASNQSGLARGYFDLAALQEIHDAMCAAAVAVGGRIDRIVYCPHGPDDGCDCRKPAPGLLRQLAEHYEIGLGSVPFIGDSLRDLEAAQAVAARGILVRTGKGQRMEADYAGGTPLEVYDDLLQVARVLLAETEA